MKDKTLEMAKYLRRMTRGEGLRSVPNPFEEAASASTPTRNLAADVANAIDPNTKANEPLPQNETLAADIAAFFADE